MVVLLLDLWHITGIVCCLYIQLVALVKPAILKGTNFDVLLTVHLSIILVINQLNAQILVS